MNLKLLEAYGASGAVTVLCRWALESYLSTAHVKPRVRGPAFLQAIKAKKDLELTGSAVHPLRASAERLAAMRDTQEAAALLEAMWPALVAAVPPDMD